MIQYDEDGNVIDPEIPDGEVGITSVDAETDTDENEPSGDAAVPSKFLSKTLQSVPTDIAESLAINDALESSRRHVGLLKPMATAVIALWAFAQVTGFLVRFH